MIRKVTVQPPLNAERKDTILLAKNSTGQFTTRFEDSCAAHNCLIGQQNRGPYQRGAERVLRKALSILFCLILTACNSKTVHNAIDLINGPPRKKIDTSQMGVNAFVNDSRFGSAQAQFLEVRDTLRLNFVRVLVAWNDQVQPTVSSTPNFSFYDEVLGSIPAGMDALVVVTGIPSWMMNKDTWIDKNPRKTFVQRWFTKVVNRYASNPRIIGWQVWNEPNDATENPNKIMDFVENASNYVEMLGYAFSVARDVTPSKKVLNAATTAINQNYPDSKDYNRSMRDAGATEFVDVWAIHYYGAQYENVVRNGGVADFLNGLDKRIWVTESGAQGVNGQLEYVERTWPFLKDNVLNIDRFYDYQFTDTSPAATTYGLRNLSTATPLSDLYIYLRDR